MSKFKGRQAARQGMDISKPERKPVCPACNGSGRYDSKGSPKCAACCGTGQKETP